MAHPEYDPENTPSRRAARAALAPRDELATPDELPENIEELSFDETQQLPEATVLSPAMTTSGAWFDDPDARSKGVPGKDYPRHGQNPVTDRPRESYIAPRPTISTSPRAEAGGKGETAAEIESTFRAQEDIQNAAQKTLTDLGIDIPTYELGALLRMHKAGAIVIPPEAVAAIEALDAASETQDEYGYANWKNRDINSEADKPHPPGFSRVSRLPPESE